MNYVNSIRYIRSFERGVGRDGVSVQRLNELCLLLGKINIGINFANIPGTTAGRATSFVVERAIWSAGYTVGYICEKYDSDGFENVRINGRIPTGQMIASAVTELSRIVGKATDSSYKMEEIEFALSLLICRICGCSFVIIETSPKYRTCFDYVCRPASVTVVPSAYDVDDGLEEIHIGCDAIRRGTREAVCGILSPTAHDALVSTCVDTGTRLSSTIGGSIEIKSRLLKKTVFDYKNHKNLVIHSASQIMVEASATAIEVLSRIKHMGIIVKPETIREAIERAENDGMLEVISVFPNVIVNVTENLGEALILKATIDELRLQDGGNIFICASDACSEDIERAFGQAGRQGGFKIESIHDMSSVDMAVKNIMDGSHESDTLIFMGNAKETAAMKIQIKSDLGMPI